LDSVATPRSDVFVYLNANENVIRILLRQTWSTMWRDSLS
jgi:hypothetical protein